MNKGEHFFTKCLPCSALLWVFHIVCFIWGVKTYKPEKIKQQRLG